MEASNNLMDLYRPVPWTSEIHVDLGGLRDELDHNRTDMSPPYQRGSVWTREQQELFMGHLLQGGEVLPVVLHRVPDSGQAEVLDGKQRIEACLAWLDGKVRARLDDGRLLAYGDLVMGKRQPVGLSRVFLRFRYTNLPWEERVRFYVRLNSAGTPHTQQQLSDALLSLPKER